MLLGLEEPSLRLRLPISGATSIENQNTRLTDLPPAVKLPGTADSRRFRQIWGTIEGIERLARHPQLARVGQG